MQKKLINVGEDTYQLSFDDFDSELDIDSLLKIDYSNIIGELITFPVIVNRFGNLLAEAESKVAEMKLNLEVFEAKTKEKLRAELSEANGGKNPTIEALNNALLINVAYQTLRKKLIDVQKTRDYINSVFWSAKDKSDKISALLKNSDITINSEVIESRINGVLIKHAEKLIK